MIVFLMICPVANKFEITKLAVSFDSSATGLVGGYRDVRTSI